MWGFNNSVKELEQHMGDAFSDEAMEARKGTMQRKVLSCESARK